MPVTQKVNNDIKLKKILETQDPLGSMKATSIPSKPIKEPFNDDTNDSSDDNNDIDVIDKKPSTTSNTSMNTIDMLSFNNPNYRLPSFYSLYLRPNSKFAGLQQSSKAKHKIEVEFKHIDLMNSLVIGFLKINGLTAEYPELATCFKGEIINNPLRKRHNKPLTKNYSFLTENNKWGSTPSNDLDHWKRLTSYFSLTDEEFCKKLSLINENEKDQGLIYMRWKEEFLLPDSRIQQINGASFEGFYYVVLNIGNSNKPDLPIGSINGLYYYKSSEKFQSLSLSSLSDRGDNQAFNFL